MKEKEIKRRYVRNENFYDEYHFLEAFEDKKTKVTLGYYRPEIYYAPHRAEQITRKEFLKNLGVKETVYGKMRNLSLDEMAEYIHNIDKAIYKGAIIALRKKGIELTGYNPVRSKEAIKKWLQTEVQND